MAWMGQKTRAKVSKKSKLLSQVEQTLASPSENLTFPYLART
jgi:hypothetical protein